MAKKRSGDSKRPKSAAKKTATPSPDHPAGDVAPEADVPVARFDRVHIWQVQAVRDVLFVALVFATVWMGYALRAVTVPLLVALMLAYLFEPIIQRTITKHPQVTRPIAVGGLLGALCVIVALAIVLIVPAALSQVALFNSRVESGQLRQDVMTKVDMVPGSHRGLFDFLVERLPEGETPGVTSGDVIVPATGEGDPETSDPEASDPDSSAAGDPSVIDVVSPPPPEVAKSLDPEVAALRAENQVLREMLGRTQTETQSQDASKWFGIARDTLQATFRFLGVVVQIGLLTFLIPFYFFFFSVWYQDVVAFGRQLIPEKNRSRTVELLEKMDRVVAGFVRGRIVISLIMGVLLGIGWMICGVPYALPVGLVVGIFCAVPYLGVIGIPLACGLAWFDASNSTWPVWLVVLLPFVWFCIVQVIEGYVLTPMIAGKATNLDPVTILVAVLAGGSVLGVYGMLLAIPLAACGKILFLEVLMPTIRAWVRGEIADPLPIERD